MKTLLFLINKGHKPELLAESVEPDIPIFEGGLIAIEVEGAGGGQLYEVLSEVWKVRIWNKKAEATRNLYLVKSLVKEDNLLRKEVLESHG